MQHERAVLLLQTCSVQESKKQTDKQTSEGTSAICCKPLPTNLSYVLQPCWFLTKTHLSQVKVLSRLCKSPMWTAFSTILVSLTWSVIAPPVTGWFSKALKNKLTGKLEVQVCWYVTVGFFPELDRWTWWMDGWMDGYSWCLEAICTQ